MLCDHEVTGLGDGALRSPVVLLVLKVLRRYAVEAPARGAEGGAGRSEGLPTLLLGRGVHPKLVQELLGHATVAMTLDTYSQYLPSMGDQASGGDGEAFG